MAGAKKSIEDRAKEQFPGRPYHLNTETGDPEPYRHREFPKRVLTGRTRPDGEPVYVTVKDAAEEARLTGSKPAARPEPTTSRRSGS
jgi:hypothetical protein